MDARDNNESLDDNAEGSLGVNSNKVCQRKPESHERGDHVFTPMSNQSEPSSANTNGPCRRLVTRGEPQQSSKPRDSTPGYTHPSAASCSQLSNNTNQPTSSRYCDNGLETNVHTCQSYTPAVDRVNNQNVTSSGSGRSNNENQEFRKRPSSLQLNKCNANDDDSSSDTGNDECSLGSEDGCVYTYRGGAHLADLPSSFFSLDMGLPIDKHLPSNVLPLLNYHGFPIQRPEEVQEHREVVHEESPDIDFDPLEMDFDPGPSVEVDGDEPSPELDILPADPIIPEEDVILVRSPDIIMSIPVVAAHSSEPVRVQPVSRVEEHYMSMPSTSSGITRASAISQNKSPEPPRREPICDSIITHVNVLGEHLRVQRTTVKPSNMAINMHSSGDLVSPREIVTHEDETAECPFAVQINRGEMPVDPLQLNSTLYHLNMAKRLVLENTAAVVEAYDISNCAGAAAPAVAPAPAVSPAPAVAPAPAGAPAPAPASPPAPALPPAPASPPAPQYTPPPRRMVWSEREACERQVTQIATSACGATAVVNVFIALGVPVNVERINEAVGTRQRANNAPLPRYLLSRAVAGCTAADLVTGIQRASDGVVTARFFPTYPERVVSLSHWLADWISLGAIPILTLNLQVDPPPDSEPPDAWHHQMVFGVSPHGIYLSNPVERVPESSVWARLTSPSVLLVRTRDVLARFSPRTDLSALAHAPRLVERFNVLGQVVNLLREWRDTGWSEQGMRTRHIRVPASYRAGVTVAALTGSEAHRRLMHATQLPLLDDTQHDEAV